MTTGEIEIKMRVRKMRKIKEKQTKYCHQTSARYKTYRRKWQRRRGVKDNDED